MKIIILAGGSGSRLWPLSSSDFPKQFVRLPGMEESLFRQTLRRSLMLADEADIKVVAGGHLKELILKDGGGLIDEGNLIIEPEPRNTLPAICLGVSGVNAEPDEPIVVFPSDHVIKESEVLTGAIKASEDLSKEYLVTFGVKPDRPHTGYGYIAPGEAYKNGFRVDSFKEKPDAGTAGEYIELGYLWNSGIFMFTESLFKSQIRDNLPDDFTENYRKLPEGFAGLKKISIDYGLLEKSSGTAVVKVDIGWNDMGGFDSFFDVFDKDADGNVKEGDCITINSSDNVIYSTTGKKVAAIDVNGLIIVDNGNGLLICRRGSSQKVREVTDVIKKENG